MTVHSNGTPNTDFTNAHIKNIADISSDSFDTEEKKFHIILVDQMDDRVVKLLKEESQVCVLCIHSGEDERKNHSLMEVSKILSGGYQYSLWTRVS